MTAQARERRPSTEHRPAGVLRPRHEPDGRAARRLPVAARGGVRPKGASLEGFLYPATYDVRVGDANATTAEDLVRMMLDAFHDRVGEERLKVAGEARPDVLRDPHARLDRRARGGPRRGAAADRRRLPEPARPRSRRSRPASSRPTRRSSTPSTRLKLATSTVADWAKYFFWTVPDGRSATSRCPRPRGLQHVQGPRACRPGPIADAEPRLDRRGAPPGHEERATCTSSPSPTASGAHDFARRSPSTSRSSRKYGYK